jgi:hypothetical protein
MHKADSLQTAALQIGQGLRDNLVIGKSVYSDMNNLVSDPSSTRICRLVRQPVGID